MLVPHPLHSLKHSLKHLIVHVSESLVGAASGQGDEDTAQFHKCHLLSNIEGITGQTHSDAKRHTDGARGDGQARLRAG
jgi:hypothetical protein